MFDFRRHSFTACNSRTNIICGSACQNRYYRRKCEILKKSFLAARHSICHAHVSAVSTARSAVRTAETRWCSGRKRCSNYWFLSRASKIRSTKLRVFAAYVYFYGDLRGSKCVSKIKTVLVKLQLLAHCTTVKKIHAFRILMPATMFRPCISEQFVSVLSNFEDFCSWECPHGCHKQICSLVSISCPISYEYD